MVKMVLVQKFPVMKSEVTKYNNLKIFTRQTSVHSFKSFNKSKLLSLPSYVDKETDIQRQDGLQNQTSTEIIIKLII